MNNQSEYKEIINKARKVNPIAYERYRLSQELIKLAKKEELNEIDHQIKSPR